MDCLPCCAEYPVQGHHIEIAADEHYDYGPSENCSHENILRLKFLGIALFKLWINVPFQLAYRGYDLFEGGFYDRGYQNALHAHRQDHSLRGQAIDSCRITCHVLLELIKDVGRIILFPLYLAGLTFCAFIGWFCPELARRLFSRLDQIFFVQPVDPYAPVTSLEAYGNLAAGCMQTREFRTEMRLHRYLAMNHAYHPHTNHALKGRLTDLLQKASSYFTAEELQPIRNNLRTEIRFKNVDPKSAPEHFSQEEITKSTPHFINPIEEATKLLNGEPSHPFVAAQREKLLKCIRSLEQAIEEWSSSTTDRYKTYLTQAANALDGTDDMPEMIQMGED